MVFLGRDSSSFYGIYSVIGGVLNVVVDESVLFPGSVYPYSSFSGVSIDQGNVAFKADAGPYTNPLRGIFADFGGGIESIITVSDVLDVKSNDIKPAPNFGTNIDMLDGKTPTQFSLSNDGLSGNKIVFSVTFTDGSLGIYQANRTTPVWGDINGDLDVNAIDVLLATQEVTGVTTLNLEQRARGNVAPLVNGIPQPVCRLLPGKVFTSFFAFFNQRFSKNFIR